MKPLTIVSSLLLAILMAAWALNTYRPPPGGSGGGPPPAEPPAVPLAAEVEEVLQKHLALIVDLLRDPDILEAARAANEKNRTLTLAEIFALDERWRNTDGVDEFIRPFLVNRAAQKLLAFQETRPGFSEIFVTDERGLNIAQTNKTTDYYQADEGWWTASYDNGRGHTSHGPIEFDASAQTEAISLYAPLLDPAAKRAIGVAKAVLSISAIKLEL